MLLPVSRLLARVRERSPKQGDLDRLKARFSAQPSRWLATREQKELAAKLSELKRELAEAFSSFTSCHRCARGEAMPKGRWDGGRCCGTRTENVFTSNEVLALKLGGVRARDLIAPDEDHAGCAFRGSRGCSLAPEERPTVCLVYACAELKTEMATAPNVERIRALRFELHETFEALLRVSGVAPDRIDVPTTLI